MRAEDAQHPPGAGGAVQGRVVVDDEAVAVAQPQSLHPARELVLGRQHVRGGVGAVHDLVEIQEDGTRNMLGFIIRPRVAAGAGQEDGRVDDPEVGRAELARQPFGRYQ
jgi:hypothetical protein